MAVFYKIIGCMLVAMVLQVNGAALRKDVFQPNEPVYEPEVLLYTYSAEDQALILDRQRSFNQFFSESGSAPDWVSSTFCSTKSRQLSIPMELTPMLSGSIVQNGKSTWWVAVLYCNQEPENVPCISLNSTTVQPQPDNSVTESPAPIITHGSGSSPALPVDTSVTGTSTEATAPSPQSPATSPDLVEPTPTSEPPDSPTEPSSPTPETSSPTPEASSPTPETSSPTPETSSPTP